MTGRRASVEDILLEYDSLRTHLKTCVTKHGICWKIPLFLPIFRFRMFSLE